MTGAHCKSTRHLKVLLPLRTPDSTRDSTFFHILMNRLQNFLSKSLATLENRRLCRYWCGKLWKSREKLNSTWEGRKTEKKTQNSMGERKASACSGGKRSLMESFFSYNNLPTLVSFPFASSSHAPGELPEKIDKFSFRFRVKRCVFFASDGRRSVLGDDTVSTLEYLV